VIIDEKKFGGLKMKVGKDINAVIRRHGKRISTQKGSPSCDTKLKRGKLRGRRVPMAYPSSRKSRSRDKKARGKKKIR